MGVNHSAVGVWDPGSLGGGVDTGGGVYSAVRVRIPPVAESQQSCLVSARVLV